MGERSFGKGSVQSILPLQDGSALRLTTAKYYTPSHKVIHGQGIMPDCPVPMTDEQEAALVMRRRPGFEYLSQQEQDEINKNARDVQLDRAMDQLRGTLIYMHRSLAYDKMAEKPEKVAANKK